uniref:Kazal-like domain-containing protein n=1 Tax=Amphimedon queenslandica TaxID=400682 RepID=A0A1X7SX32_AMPQE
MDEYDTLVNPSGVCSNYLQIGATCPAPSVAPSVLCQSSINKCHPNARCLPDVDYQYTCQPQPVVCTSDSTCQPNYYCSSGTIPTDNSNYYQNSDKSLPGQSVFLQENLMHFSGESITRTNVLPVHEVPGLVSDLTIFAIVNQEPGNDGYVIGKGLNDKMRDFGLYLRSSKSTIWLAYGSDDKGVGFHGIVFFYDVNVADGNEHSVTAIIDGSANSASLYIDGVLRGYQCPLPVKPAFRPDYNILYVGGRPGTKRFQFKGSIRNLFIGSSAFQYDNVKQLHDDAFDGDRSLCLDTTDTRYCLQYIGSNERCIVGDKDFRCHPTQVCVPDFAASVAKQLPIQGTSFHLYGLCRTPCDCDNTVSYECGIDGNTYLNSCMRVCANVLKLHDGQCFNYALAYAACNGTFSSQ